MFLTSPQREVSLSELHPPDLIVKELSAISSLMLTPALLAAASATSALPEREGEGGRERERERESESHYHPRQWTFQPLQPELTPGVQELSLEEGGRGGAGGRRGGRRSHGTSQANLKTGAQKLGSEVPRPRRLDHMFGHHFHSAVSVSDMS